MTCVNSDLHLRCGTGVISVRSATFGRRSTDTCGPARPQNFMLTLQCSRDTPPVGKWCNGLSDCVVSKDILASDPCIHAFKYYITTYTCIPAKISVTCEGGQSTLTCGGRTKIKIIAANYGRTDETTCPTRHRHQNNDCRSPNSLAIVSDRCEGRNKCTISASNDVFSDPCVKTRKYLWIVYYCVMN
ncbi:L-rhamnose-binding lectin CSL1 isoform X1 [Danio aesculapii]|uniref:L-rhamnose-binding lectin CSL1 isoform X1 n=1 Tax=Danio aesculapii TaxID=1142201 RepID=UPI0024C06B2A|nr:L-rhamnose-binding lectin CSL1 isoform X1 [Danio aesculapii]